jgi:predicted exporter
MSRLDDATQDVEALRRLVQAVRRLVWSLIGLAVAVTALVGLLHG